MAFSGQWPRFWPCAGNIKYGRWFSVQPAIGFDHDQNALLLGGSGFVGTWLPTACRRPASMSPSRPAAAGATKANIMLPQVEWSRPASMTTQLVELIRGQDVVINLVGTCCTTMTHQIPLWGFWCRPRRAAEEDRRGNETDRCPPPRALPARSVPRWAAVRIHPLEGAGEPSSWRPPRDLDIDRLLPVGDLRYRRQFPQHLRQGAEDCPVLRVGGMPGKVQPTSATLPTPSFLHRESRHLR